MAINRRPPAMLLAGAAGLDFLNSIATPVDVVVDWIADGEGYLDWLAEAKLAPREVLSDIRARASRNELDKVAEQARNLREWFRGFAIGHSGRPLTRDALSELAPLNRLLERDELFCEITPTGAPQRPFELARLRRCRNPESLLQPVAEALAQLVSEEDFSNVKACEGPICTLLFVDHTRGHARRWCSMAICGNRAKQAAHRSRKRLGA